MWIFTSKSFLSVVVDRSHPSRLLVRASVCHQTNLVTVAEEIAKRETRNQNLLTKPHIFRSQQAFGCKRDNYNAKFLNKGFAFSGSHFKG